MPPFINGLLLGFIFLISLGPAFFALIQTSLQQGFRKAVFFALGISMSDIFFVMIILFGLSKAFESEQVKFWMALFGSGMLISYAVYSWVKKPVYQEVEMSNDVNFFKYFLKGFLLNGLNPFIIITWAAWISTIAVNFEYNFNQQIQFFVGMLLSILALDLTKAYIADKLKHMITVRFIRVMNRVVAIIIFLFALRLIFFLLEPYI